jgi:hypothetical protein
MRFVDQYFPQRIAAMVMWKFEEEFASMKQVYDCDFDAYRKCMLLCNITWNSTLPPISEYLLMKISRLVCIELKYPHGRNFPASLMILSIGSLVRLMPISSILSCNALFPCPSNGFATPAIK